MVFTLEADGIFSAVENKYGSFTYKSLAEPDADGVSLLIYNRLPWNLPLTGNGRYALFAASIMCILTGVLILRRRERD